MPRRVDQTTKNSPDLCPGSKLEREHEDYFRRITVFQLHGGLCMDWDWQSVTGSEHVVELLQPNTIFPSLCEYYAFKLQKLFRAKP